MNLFLLEKHHPWQIQGSLEADQEPLCQAGNKMTNVPTNSMQHSATHFDSILVAKNYDVSFLYFFDLL